MTIDFDKAKKLLMDKPFISKEEYNRRFWDLWEKKKENTKRGENNNG